MASLERNGVRLGYVETTVDGHGGGDRELILIHGWGAHSGFLRHQQEAFAAQHRVVAPDLRGHGASDAPDTGYSISQLASDVLWLADRLGLNRPVVIGHGLGAAVAIELACRAPQRVRAVVALDGLLALSEEFEYVVRSVGSGLQTSHHAEALGNIVERDLFLTTDDPQVRGWVVEQMRLVPQHVLVQTLLANQQWDSDGAVADCSVPVYYIASATTPADLRRLAALSPGMTLTMTPEVGHFHQLLAPERVNALITSFVDALEQREARHGPAEPTLAAGDVASVVASGSTTPVVPPLDLPSVPPLPSAPALPATPLSVASPKSPPPVV